MIQMEPKDSAQGTDGPSEEESLAGVLSHPVRRQIVEHLRGRDGEGLRLLTIHVTRREADRQGTSISEIGHDSVRREIEEDHLPPLVEAGLLSYTQDTEWVELNGHNNEILDRVLNDG